MNSRQHLYKRVYALRRAIIPHILLAGTRPPQKGESGPQKFVSLTDDLDDVLADYLRKEGLLATRRQQRKGTKP